MRVYNYQNGNTQSVLRVYGCQKHICTSKSKQNISSFLPFTKIGKDKKKNPRNILIKTFYCLV